MDHKSLKVLLFVHVYILLCASLPLSKKQPEGKEDIFNKLISREERSILSDWSKDENSVFPPSRPSEEKSKVQSQRREEESARERLLRGVLDLNKRRLEQAKQSQGTNEKREPQRCWPWEKWCHGRDTSTEERENIREEKISNDARMDDMEIEKMKEYDMELEKALKKVQMKVPDALSNQM